MAEKRGIITGWLPLTELQKTLVMLVAAVSSDPLAVSLVAGGLDSLAGWSEMEGIQFCEPRMVKFMEDDSDDIDAE